MGSVRTQLVDRASGGGYVQHLVPAAAGAFVGRVRREFDDLLDRINAACFDASSARISPGRASP